MALFLVEIEELCLTTIHHTTESAADVTRTQPAPQLWVNNIGIQAKK